MKRHVPHIPFPNFAFVPGKGPHPKRVPEEHRLQIPTPIVYEPGNWEQNQAYLFGVDLYHGGFLWEAHEVWEPLWQTAKRCDSAGGLFFKALIQWAAAILHGRNENLKSFKHVGSRAVTHFRTVRSEKGEYFMGLDLCPTVENFEFFIDVACIPITEIPKLNLKTSENVQS